ncbi:hypothetical protein [uncultured Psychroserpens sp.]|uniref:hypothetical protein n=1 Tax=uncultured Psychroserpens sp. TaxID=255436 RepID=UPI0026337986|nr:hypothetical protein [uncultured Psychroserpens sp.]
MEKTMHLVAQYLATSAISFIEKKDDDSHTNLGWMAHKLETHKFLNGGKLSLSYDDFSLVWTHDNGEKEQYFLNEKNHKQITDWITQISKNSGLEKSYRYDLHYELPYDKVENSTLFRLTDQNRLNQLIGYRNLAQKVLKTILESNKFASTIRIWPHHFDTGAFVNVTDDLSIGLGMAMPDSLMNDFYFYVSGYHGDDAVIVKQPYSLSNGNYYNDDWKGFALSLKNIKKATAIRFCQEAIDIYKIQ